MPCSKVLQLLWSFLHLNAKKGCRSSWERKTRAAQSNSNFLKEPIKLPSAESSHRVREGSARLVTSKQKSRQNTKSWHWWFGRWPEAPVQIIRTRLSGFENLFFFFFKMVKTTKASFAVLFPYLSRLSVGVFNLTDYDLSSGPETKCLFILVIKKMNPEDFLNDSIERLLSLSRKYTPECTHSCTSQLHTAKAAR